jgi:hypothetical protein
MDWIELARDSKMWNGGGGACTGLKRLRAVKGRSESVELGVD